MKKNILKKIISGVAIAIAGLTVVGLISNLVKLDECEHENVVELPAVEATCVSTGLTAGEKCEDCDEVIVAQKVVTVPHIDTDENYVCDSCGKNVGPTANYVEVAIQDLDNVFVILSGKWLRVYKPAEGKEKPAYLTGIDNDDRSFALSIIYITSSGIKNSNGKYVYFEGIDVIETDEYFDIHWEVGPCEVKTMDGELLYSTYVIDQLMLDNDRDYLDGFYLLEPPAANN